MDLKTVLEQINARYLRALGFIFIKVEDGVKLIFHGKGMVISYNEGLDVYNIQKISFPKGICKINEKTEIYCDYLADEIEQHFKIAYGGFKPQFG